MFNKLFLSRTGSLSISIRIFLKICFIFLIIYILPFFLEILKHKKGLELQLNLQLYIEKIEHQFPNHQSLNNKFAKAKQLINDISLINRLMKSKKNQKKYIYIEDKFGKLLFKKIKYVKKKSI